MVSQLMLSDLLRKFHKHFPFEKNLPAAVEEYFKFSEKEKLFCYYCGVELLDNATKETQQKTPSLEHKEPRKYGGTNSFDNIEIVCYRCNICKGTMRENTYKKFLIALEKEGIKEQVLSEMYAGQFARQMNELFGKKTEKKEPKRLLDYA